MTTQEIEQLKQRCEKAEAACAEMRRVILDKLCLETGKPVPGFNVQGDVSHALSIDCGKGWLSPEERDRLVTDHRNIAETYRLEAKKVERLRAVLLGIAEGKQLPDSKDSNGLSAGEISVGDLRRVFRALEETKSN